MLFRSRQGEHALLHVDDHQGARHRGLLDRHEDRMAHLALDRLGEMALAVSVLDQQDLARADDARLAVARLDRHAAVEVDDVLPARRRVPGVVVAAGRLAEDDAGCRDGRGSLAAGTLVLPFDFDVIRRIGRASCRERV